LFSAGDFFLVDGSGDTKDVSSSFCPGLSFGRRPAGPGNFLDVGVLLTDGVLEWLLFTTGVTAW